MIQGQAERLTKVKAKAGKWTIGWEKMSESTGTYDSYEINSRDMPNDDLPKRLQVMANHVADICELPPGAAKKIVASGVSINYTEDNCYVVITAQKALINSKSPLLINTPARPLYPGEDEDDNYCMSEELYDDLIILEKEALKYVRGERAQQVLDFGGNDDEPPKKKSPSKDKGHGHVIPMVAKPKG